MPKEMWLNLAAHVPLQPISISIRSLSSSSPGKPLLGAAGDIQVAPADAGGSMVYWAAVGEQPPTPGSPASVSARKASSPPSASIR
ncbi:MAG: hypothetical protein R3F14_02210 [Polyangiaceae bacterium]